MPDTSTTNALAHDLCALIGSLQRQHDAGLNPTFGQLSNLFGWAERLQVALEAGADLGLTTHAEACQSCQRWAQDIGTAYGQRLCVECRDRVAAAVAVVQALPPQILAEQLRASWPAADRRLS